MATAAAVGLASTAIVAAGGGSAAAADLPNAQAVGRLVDGALGGNPIQSVADVDDARAKAPGDTSVQNPLSVTLLNAINLPLTNVIKLPTAPAVQAGVANQVASANLNGASNGAAGAVKNNGGALLGSDTPTQGFATVNLDGSVLNNISIPGLPAITGLLPAGTPLSVDALGGVTASVGAVYSSVGTEKGGDVITPSSGVASLNLSIGSPALGAVLTQLKTVFSSTLLGGLAGAIPLGNCALTSPTVAPIDLAGADAGVTLDVENAKITLDLAKLVKSITGLDIANPQTSNFDLISFLIKQLPTILSQGVSKLVTSLTTSLANQFKTCVANVPLLGPVLNTVIDQLLAGQGTIVGALTTVANSLGGAGSTGLTALADGLKNIVDIGLNVQSGPGIQKKDSDYPFESNLSATPNQSTAVVKNQTLVRAIEIQVLNAAAAGGLGNIPTLPALGSNSAKVKQLAGAAAGRPVALAPGGGLLNLALANSAAGPSQAAAPTTAPSTSVPATVVPDTNIPTGIPAGQAAGSHDDGLPVLPLVAILMLLTVSGGAFWQYRMRGLHQG